jgi:DNA repair protein RecO
VAKGARRPKSPFRGKLDLFYVCDFSFARSRRSELHTLREATLRESHSALRKDLGWLEQASYAAALIEQTTETETPLGGFFKMFSGFITALATHPPRPQTVLAFELKLLAELGLRPDLNGSVLTPGSKAIVQKLAGLDWTAMVSLKPSAIQTRELDTFLRDFLSVNLNRVPVGRAAALSVF